MRSGSLLSTLAARLSVLVVLASVGLVSASAPASAQACIAGVDSDFDGDGVADLAIADPDATVGSAERAGRVHIAYGDGSSQTVTQSVIPDNDNAAGDRFGFAMDATDWNGDGCTDLFVAAPFENWANNTLPEAGVVVFIPGSPSGLDPAAAEVWSQDGLGVDASEVGDRFGYDLAAGTDAFGEPYLVVGMPGESSGPVVNGGQVVYVRPDAAIDFNQNSVGIPGDFETGDMYGYSVTASESGFAVGGPGEAIGSVDYAGTVHLFSHNDATAIPTVIAGWDQSTSGISGTPEVGDMYGHDLHMVDYISTTGGAARMMLAIGTPGEAIGSETSAGLSSVVWSPGTGVTEYRNISQDHDKNPDDSAEPGDAFGASVVMVNRTPGQNTSTDTLLVAIGSPGEDLDGLHDVGEIALFSMTEGVSEGGDPVRAILASAGHDLAAGDGIGSILHATQTHLFVAVPRATTPAVYGVPWDNIVADGNDEVLAYTPDDFGVSGGIGSFGASLA